MCHNGEILMMDFVLKYNRNKWEPLGFRKFDVRQFEINSQDKDLLPGDEIGIYCNACPGGD